MGANSETIFVFGDTSARYSPPTESLKFVYSVSVALVFFFSEAKTSKQPLSGTATFGNRHLVRLSESSVRNHPSRFAVVAPELKISIQSDRSPSSSWSVRLLSAMNSEICNPGATPPKSNAYVQFPPANGCGVIDRSVIFWSARQATDTVPSGGCGNVKRNCPG